VLAQDNNLTALFEATFNDPIPTTEDSGYSLRILRKPHKVAESTDLASLFKRMDLAISKQDEFSGRSYHRLAPFRSRLATEQQQAFIANKIGESSLQEETDYVYDSNVEDLYLRMERREGERIAEMKLRHHEFGARADGAERKKADVIPAVWIGHPFANNEMVQIKDLTNGQARDIITRLRLGASMKKLSEKETLRRESEEREARRGGEKLAEDPPTPSLVRSLFSFFGYGLNKSG
jgi:hypothetical protein